MVTQLVPFKVTTLDIPGVITNENIVNIMKGVNFYYYGRLNKSENSVNTEEEEPEIKEKKPNRWEIVQDICRGKVWTVAAVSDHMFLLVRPGELTQWYPEDACIVVSEEV